MRPGPDIFSFWLLLTLLASEVQNPTGLSLLLFARRFFDCKDLPYRAAPDGLTGVLYGKLLYG